MAQTEDREEGAKEEDTLRLEGCIQFWEAKLRCDRGLFEPSTVVQIESTVSFLKKLLEMERR